MKIKRKRPASPEPLEIVYRTSKKRVPRIRRRRRSSTNEDAMSVYVEYYRASYVEGRALEGYLRDFEAVKSVSTPLRKASGAVELGYLLHIYVLPVIVSYAGNKVLKIVEDHVKRWLKDHGKKDQFITLGLSGQGRPRKIGKGRPKRYR